jgi:hypothetical protein
MSRGRGTIERYILDHLQRRRGELLPVPILAQMYRSKHNGGSASSFRRAAARLLAEGEIDAYDVLVPTRRDERGKPTSGRWVTCIALADTDLGDDPYLAPRLAMEAMYVPESLDTDSRT